MIQVGCLCPTDENCMGFDTKHPHITCRKLGRSECERIAANAPEPEPIDTPLADLLEQHAMLRGLAAVHANHLAEMGEWEASLIDEAEDALRDYRAKAARIAAEIERRTEPSAELLLGAKAALFVMDEEPFSVLRDYKDATGSDAIDKDLLRHAIAKHEAAQQPAEASNVRPVFSWMNEKELAAIAKLASWLDMSYEGILRHALGFYQLSLMVGREGYQTKFLNSKGEEWMPPVGCPDLSDDDIQQPAEAHEGWIRSDCQNCYGVNTLLSNARQYWCEACGDTNIEAHVSRESKA